MDGGVVGVWHAVGVLRDQTRLAVPACVGGWWGGLFAWCLGWLACPLLGAGSGWWRGLLFEICIVDASIFVAECCVMFLCGKL